MVRLLKVGSSTKLKTYITMLADWKSMNGELGNEDEMDVTKWSQSTELFRT